MRYFAILLLFLAAPCYAQTTPVARWKMEEATGSATLVDSINGYNLTVTSGSLDITSGVIDFYAQDFEATTDTEYAEVADTADLSGGNVKFGGTCWIKPESTSGTPVIAMKGWQATPDANREWVLYMSSATAIKFQIEKADGTGTAEVTSSTIAISAGNWYFVSWWYDPVTDLLNLKINDAPVQTFANTTGSYDGTRPFTVGASASQALYFDGVIDDFRWYKNNFPDAAELTQMYAAGFIQRYTEFYCNYSTGSNMNGGSDENTSPSYSFTNGGWDATTGVYTPTSGNPSLTVTPGQYASVFIDGATAPVFIGVVTAVDTTTITVSLTTKSGTAPTTLGTTRSINVGGVWKGPNAANGFPFNLITNAVERNTSVPVRINYKNNATYNVTAAMTGTTYTGYLLHEGYTTTPGDGGITKIDGGVAGNRYVLLTLTNSSGACFRNFWFTRAGGASTVQTGVVAGSNSFFNCTFSNFSSNGLNGGYLFGCEAYSNGQSGFSVPSLANNCISYNNTTNGFDFTNAGNSVTNCIAHNNTTNGFYMRATATRYSMHLIDCDAYENGQSGFVMAKDSGASLFGMVLQDCNAVKNGQYGIAFPSSTSTQAAVWLRKVGFGTGTMVNAWGDIQPSTPGKVFLVDVIRYPANSTPWVDPEVGNFRVNLAQAKGAGEGTFRQTSTGLGYTGGTVGYQDIGAAPHSDEPAWLQFDLCD